MIYTSNIKAPKVNESLVFCVDYKPFIVGAFILLIMRRINIKGAVCPICGSTDITSKGRWNRIAYIKGQPNGEDRRYLCRNCGKYFCSVNRVWNNKEGVQCKHCGSTNLRKRRRGKRVDPYYYCFDCGRFSTFSDWSARREALSKIENGQKLCSACGEIKDVAEFNKTDKNKHGFRGMCKKCVRERINYQLRYLRQYGLNKDDLYLLLKIQNHRCLICGESIIITQTKKTGCVDHCHKTNQVRGLLCNNCNKLLGLAKDNIMILERAILYLKREINILSHGNNL